MPENAAEGPPEGMKKTADARLAVHDSIKDQRRVRAITAEFADLR